MVPPWASTMALQMASPIPLEVLPSPRWNGSKMRSASDSGTPAPRSETSIRTSSSEPRATTHTSVPAGAWRAEVGEQVGDDLFELCVVAVHEGQVVGEVRADPDVGEERSEAVETVEEQLLDVHGLAVGSEGVRLDAAEAQQVGHEAVEALGLVRHE